MILVFFKVVEELLLPVFPISKPLLLLFTSTGGTDLGPEVLFL